MHQDTLTVARLGAVLAHVAVLVAVAALDAREIARLSTLLGDVALLAAVAAGTVAAALGTVAREVAH